MRCSHGETFPWREELQQSPEVGTEPCQMGEAGRGEVQVQGGEGGVFALTLRVSDYRVRRVDDWEPEQNPESR